MQQEIQQIREQYARLEVLRDNLDREVKTIPALNESNEILKNDLANVRKRFKEEKASLTKQIKHLESQIKDTDSLKNEIRQLAMRLMEVAGAPIGGVASIANLPSTYGVSSSSRYDPSASVMSVQSNAYRSSNPPQQQHHSSNYTSGHHLDEDDDEDNSRGDDNSYLGGNDGESEYDNASFIDDNASQHTVNSSIDSLPNNGGNHHHSSSNQMMMMQATSAKTSSSGKKKKVKKAVVTSTRSTNGASMQGQQGNNMHNMMQPNMMQSSFTLPRI